MGAGCKDISLSCSPPQNGIVVKDAKLCFDLYIDGQSESNSKAYQYQLVLYQLLKLMVTLKTRNLQPRNQCEHVLQLQQYTALFFKALYHSLYKCIISDYNKRLSMV